MTTNDDPVRILTKEALVQWAEVERARADFARVSGALIQQPHVIAAARAEVDGLLRGFEEIMRELCAATREADLALLEARARQRLT